MQHTPIGGELGVTGDLKVLIDLTTLFAIMRAIMRAVLQRVASSSVTGTANLLLPKLCQ